MRTSRNFTRRDSMTLRDAFDPRNNSLNAIRLAMAIGVIFWHSFPLTGRDIGFEPLRQFVGEVWVDGFFAISGFLITRSWMRRPDVRAYLSARLVRIVPAFYVCLVVTALVVAPIGVLSQGGNAWSLLTSSAPIRYVLENLGIWTFGYDVGGTPTGVPYPGVWNGSLWTLGWEVLCYLAVMVLGVIGALKRGWILPTAFIGMLSILLTWIFVPLPWLITTGARFAIVFIAGALIYQYQDRIRCSWPLVATAVSITVGSMWLDDYRLVGALPWAYAVICIGSLVKHPRLRFENNDVSYGMYIYAFPVQQLLVIWFGTLTPALFWLLATGCTIIPAFASWRLIEKPALAAKKRRTASKQRDPIAAS